MVLSAKRTAFPERPCCRDSIFNFPVVPSTPTYNNGRMWRTGGEALKAKAWMLWRCCSTRERWSWSLKTANTSCRMRAWPKWVCYFRRTWSSKWVRRPSINSCLKLSSTSKARSCIHLRSTTCLSYQMHIKNMRIIKNTYYKTAKSYRSKI